MQSPPSPELKERQRREMIARRDALADDFREQASDRIIGRALDLPELNGITPVGAYWPIRSEVDPRLLMEELVARGQDVALSQILHPHLSWRLWQPGDVLVKGGFGVREPGPDAPQIFPKALIVPLVAFDRRGGRIGYGKGHFDRAIAALETQHPVLTVGLAYAVQEIDEVPVEPHDRLLDVIITEAELIRTTSA
ncbi:5-formyltetrahydrofolate cyclo-ligase [Microvirga sp. VF16]|uniref:5-formyltetrahydrofolate cyclo-ligase n=1 Tax=Microvirga sp. VF16 TaxID=2807101 RepID=UPI00193CAACE|nr:5-formyltetrahydrofolate cyclo-ligase [Microvirga sp. VF16]QRM28883.1 5-formyltetrahydrofolate cyclo-ligase [Microvirga sp. VF16]